MLAYVFWHFPRAGVSLDEYGGALVAFEAEFQKLNHTMDVQSFQVEAVDWFNKGAPSYFDWYEISDSGKLDAINTDAVSGDRLEPHHKIAMMTGGGAGSMYRYEYPGCPVDEAKYSVWFSKPDGMSYADFREKIQGVYVSGNSVVQRFMGLGPSPEFCVISKAKVELPEGIKGEYRTLTPIGMVGQ